MKSEKNRQLAKHFLEKLGSGASADEVVALCAPDMKWDVPGDPDAFPWVGHKVGRDAIRAFIEDSKVMISRESLEIHDMLASEERAVILGHLRTRVSATGKLIDCAFAIVLAFRDDEIAQFLMLEDSFAVSAAVR